MPPDCSHERVADGGRDVAREQRVGLGAREADERQLDHGALARRGGQRVEQDRARRRGAEGEHDQDAAARRAAQQVGDELQRRVVGPVQVVEREHDAGVGAQRLQQRADRAVGLEALVLEAAGGGARQPVEPGHDRRQLGRLGADEAREAVGAQRRGVVAERVDGDPERQVLLQLGGAAAEHEVAARVGTRAELVDEPRLADPGLPADRQDRRAAGLQPGERVGDGGQLRAATDERRQTIHLFDDAHRR